MLHSSKYSFDYNNDTVKKLEQKSKSAGNISKDEYGTLETLRSGIVINSEHIKEISDHVPKHNKPLNNKELGYYLAGLIDGQGHFDKIKQLIIVFPSLDAFLAYYIKKRLGYGKVKKLNNKNAHILVVSNKQGIINILNLINGKLRTKDTFNQVINNIVNDTEYKLHSNFTMDLSDDFNNYWLAGFSDTNAMFNVNIIQPVPLSKNNIPEVRLNFIVNLKNLLLLQMIKSYLGGNIEYRKTQDTYYYDSTSFGSARKVIHYFDKFNLQSKKNISFLRWRKMYRLVQKREHLTEKGLSKITKQLR